MKEKKEVKTTWSFWGHIQTIDMVSRELSEIDVRQDVVCYDLNNKKITIDLWDCEFSHITNMVAKKADFGMRFRIFRRQGGLENKTIEAPAWLYDKNVRKPKKTKGDPKQQLLAIPGVKAGSSLLSIE